MRSRFIGPKFSRYIVSAFNVPDGSVYRRPRSCVAISFLTYADRAVEIAQYGGGMYNWARLQLAKKSLHHPLTIHLLKGPTYDRFNFLRRGGSRGGSRVGELWIK
jgi:hypothetical protein